MKRLLLIGVIAALLGACAKESSRPIASGEGTVRAINAIPGSPSVTFLIEERALGGMNYKEAAGGSPWDALSYTFNFDVVLAGNNTPTRVARQPIDVERDMDYTLLISGALNAPDVTVLATPEREFNGDETVFEMRFGHLGATLGDIDIYLDDAAVPPALGSQRATLSSGEFSDPIDISSGDLVLTVTPAGDDSTVLFESDEITFPSLASLMINVFDGDENDLSPLAVRTINRVGGGSSVLRDIRFAPTLRFIHASRNMPAADIYLDDPLTVPVITDHAYRDIDGPVDAVPGSVPVTYTDSTNMGSMLIDEDVIVGTGAIIDMFVAADADGNDVLIPNIADRRSVSTIARLIIINAAAGRDAVDLYLVPTGEALEDHNPLFTGLPLASVPFNFPLSPDVYDFYVTDVGETTPLTGPILLDAMAGDVFETILYDNVDPNIVDFDFLP